MKNIKKGLVSVVFLIPFVFVGCANKIEVRKNISQAKIQKVSWEDIDGFQTDNLNLALDVFKKDCKAQKVNKNLIQTCQTAFALDSNTTAKSFFMKNFTPYKLYNKEKKSTGLITGYYEPLLHGSYFKTSKYKYPIYEVPTDLLKIDLSKAYPSLANYTLRGRFQDNKIIPYLSRKEIEKLSLKINRYLKPICYVDDKVDLFFLQIQGSGKIVLPNGRFIYVGYGEQNGWPYYSIGRYLIKIGAIKKENISLQSIKEWLKAHPDKIDEVLNKNQSYVFFNQNNEGAKGSLDVALVPNRNIAVDTRYIPLGFPVFINTTNPLTKKPLNKLTISADTGGAIKGVVRADIFFGYGEEAHKLAGNMKQEGTMYILVPNNLIKTNTKEKNVFNK